MRIVQRTRDRLLKRNQNMLLMICGQTGTGKSMSALRLARLIDPNFTIEQVVFNAQEFLNLIRSGKLQRGSVIVFDEAGAGAGLAARDAMTRVNRALNYFLQGFRAYNFCVIFTVPNFMSVDTGLRRLAHCYLQTHKIYRRKKMCELKWLDLYKNALTGQITPFYPRFILPNGCRIKICAIRVCLPDADIIRQYETKKKEWLDNLTDATIEKMADDDKNDEDEKKREAEIEASLNTILEDVIRRKEEFGKEWAGRYNISWQTIMVEFKLTAPQAHLLKIRAEKAVNDEMEKIERERIEYERNKGKARAAIDYAPFNI